MICLIIPNDNGAPIAFVMLYTGVDFYCHCSEYVWLFPVYDIVWFSVLFRIIFKIKFKTFIIKWVLVLFLFFCFFLSNKKKIYKLWPNIVAYDWYSIKWEKNKTNIYPVFLKYLFSLNNYSNFNIFLALSIF